MPSPCLCDDRGGHASNQRLISINGSGASSCHVDRCLAEELEDGR
jgi:hypothetical protein